MHPLPVLALALVAALPFRAFAHPHHGDEDHPLAAHRAAIPALSAAFEAAWRKSVDAVHAAGRLTRAEAERAAAERWLAGTPVVELDHDRTGSGGSAARESEAAVVFPLHWAGQRASRASLAEAVAELAEAGLHAARWTLAGEVREAAWAVAAAQAERDGARDHAASQQALLADVERRVAAGDLARADALAARSEALAARAQVAQLDAQLDAAQSRWTLLTGSPPVADPSEPDASTMLEHPAIELARRTRERAERHAHQVRSARREPWELAVRLRTERSGPGLPTENGAGVGVRIPIGSPPAQGPREAAATAELDVARAEEDLAARRVKSGEAAARSAYEASGRRVEAGRARVAALREREALLDKSFRMGETALPELLRARAERAQAEAALARQTSEQGLARARLLQARGRLP